MLKPLKRKTVAPIPSRPVKVLQFGEGNFLRAFADWIIDILNEQTPFNGDIKIVQPLPAGMGNRLNEHDGLYHVVLTGIDQGRAIQDVRLITSVQGVINPYSNFSEYLEEAKNPSLRFVLSNTTEAGIVFNEKDHTPGSVSESFPGKLTSFLYHRYQHFQGAADKGLIFLPCELIDKNGDMLRNTILRYVQHWQLPSGFKSWIEEHNTFCNTLVDRIVPGYPKDSIDTLQKLTGYEDRTMVQAEYFHLWVIEGPDFVAGEFPAADTRLQVKFVKDLTPYRTRKVRILNGAHTAMVPVAYLRGLRTVQEAVEHPETGDYIQRLIYQEIIPTLDLPEDELKQFASAVLDRFRNPFIRHELASIALNSISKFKVRVLPSLLEYYTQKQVLPSLMVESLAKLILFYRGLDEEETIPLNDSKEVLSFFESTWASADPEKVVTAVLSNTAFWDMDLRTLDGLEQQVLLHVNKILKSKPVL